MSGFDGSVRCLQNIGWEFDSPPGLTKTWGVPFIGEQRVLKTRGVSEGARGSIPTLSA